MTHVIGLFTLEMDYNSTVSDLRAADYNLNRSDYVLVSMLLEMLWAAAQ